MLSHQQLPMEIIRDYRTREKLTFRLKNYFLSKDQYFRRCKQMQILEQHDSNSFSLHYEDKINKQNRHFLPWVNVKGQIERTDKPKSRRTCNSNIWRNKTISSGLIHFHDTATHKDQHCTNSSLILNCIYNTVMGPPRTPYATTMWKYIRIE